MRMANYKRLIDQIKEENIHPIPKWYFITKNITVFLFFLISVLIGAATFSIILFSIQQTEFNIVQHLSDSRVKLFLWMLPLFWIITLLIFLVASIVSINKSKKGYKYTWPRLIIFNTVASMLLGTLLFFGGGGQWLEEAFAEKVSIYESIDEKKKKIWMLPEEGYLSGTIEAVSDNTLRLTDFHKKEWTIDFTDAFVAQSVFMEQGDKIKLIGKITGTNDFLAEEVRPWGGPEHRKKMMERRQKRQDGKSQDGQRQGGKK